MQPDQSQDHKQPATGELSATPPVELPTSAEVANQTRDENQQAPQKRLLEGLSSRINWLTLLNVVVGLSTIIQAFYTYKGLQFTAAANQMTRDSVELTRQQLALTRELERAHVVIQDVGPLPLIDKQRVPITLKNIGRAAATDVQVWTAHNSMGEAPLSKDTGLQCV